MELSQDQKERRNATSFVAFGILIGSSVGAVLFAITGNAIWVGVLTGLGVAVGSILSVLEANRASSRARS